VRMPLPCPPRCRRFALRSTPWEGLLAAVASAVLAPLPAAAAEPAGVSAAVRGEVRLARARATERPVASGEDIWLQDALTSGPSSGMQILLLDETVFTLGPESALVVDEFVYDPDTGRGELAARVTRGVFRFVSGRIAREDPEDVSIALPAGTIGIRGTVVGGWADEATRASTVVLLGEGRDNDVGARPAAIDVCNAGECVSIRRAGFATRIAGAAEAPLAPFRLPHDEVAAFGAALAPQPGRAAVEDAGMEAGSARELSGALDAEALALANELFAEADTLAGLTANATQDERDVAAEVAALAPRELTTIGDLFQLQTGTAVYHRDGIPLSDGGSYDVALSLDFGSRILSGAATHINSPALGLFGLSSSGSSSYADLPGSTPAVLDFQEPPTPPSTSCPTGCVLAGRISFFNQGDVTAAEAEVGIEIQDGVVPVSGNGVVPRVQ